MTPNGSRLLRESRLAVRIHPLHTRNAADTGRSTRFAPIWRRVTSTTPWIQPLSVMYSMSAAIQSSPLTELRTLSGLSSQVCSNSRCAAREKLSTAIMSSSAPATVTFVSVPDAGENASLTASAPPPVRS